MHVSGIYPTEERLACRMLALDPILGGRDELIVAGLHAFLGEWACVLDLLLADLAEARINRRVVLVSCYAAQDSARAEFLAELRKVFLIRIVGQFRLFFGVEVIKVAEEFIKAVHGWQVLVAVAQVV